MGHVILESFLDAFPDVKLAIATVPIKEREEIKYNIDIVKNIKRIICNDPATIIFWNDGTKTVVKCDEMDYYDAEVGIKTAILKKLLGNKSNYNNLIYKALKKAELE